MTIQEEISYLANAMSDEQRKGMFLANAGFASDAQRKAVMAKLNPGGGGGIYGDTAHFKDEETVMKDTAEMWGYDVNDPVFREAWEKAFVDNLARDGYTRDDWNNYKGELGHSCRREQFSVVAASTINDYLPGKPTLKNRDTVRSRIQDEIVERALVLANKELTDEQRKAIFAKMGGGGSGGGNRQVYTRAGSGGGGGGGSGPTGPLTVQTTRNAGVGGGYHYTGADDMTSSWVTRLSPDQMKEELKNDPDRLKAAIEEQLRMGAYDGLKVNGHDPSVMDIINNGLTPSSAKQAPVLSAEEWARLGAGSSSEASSSGGGGGGVMAITPDLSQFGKTSPSEQAKQDVSTDTSTGGSSGGDDSVSLPDAIDNLPSGGGSYGGDGGGSSAPNYLQEFLDALALAHF